MDFLERLTGREVGQVRSLAVRVAVISVEGAWQRVAEQVLEMRPSEARGYIRARSAAVVYEKTDAILRHRTELTARRTDIVRQASERLVRHLAERAAELRVLDLQPLPVRRAA